MTPKISLVAVCCSKRLLEFLEQPHVLDRDHGLIGEGFEQLDLRRSEGTHLGATCVQGSNKLPLLTKWNTQVSAPNAAKATANGEIVLRADIGNVVRAMLAHPTPMWLIDTDSSRPTGMDPK